MKAQQLKGKCNPVVAEITSALSVARNQLCNVDHLLRPFSDLQELSLSHNLLNRFPRGLPPSLESLLLQENRITYITSGALRQLGNLTRLDLEDNRIRAIQPGALQGLNKLQVLTLKGNKLTSLPLNLPPSLTHLDLSANCISVLDLPSLSALVNLQVLKINSNCLRSVPESAFDSLPRLRSVDLTNNLWVCECDILYLYRWLLSGRVRMATDLVCTEPVHLAHRLLLNLSVMAICPRVVKPNERTHPQDISSTLERKLETVTVRPMIPSSFNDRREAPWPTPNPQPLAQQDSAAVIALLAVLCVLVALLMLAVLFVLKNVLLRHQRVAPLNAGSGG
ncbi:leucine-rich repeat and transmembrane domain-containing protein 1 [Epinephelus fuscoguttatus]|uniref:leucine-rich repeat and transmembrane domain-containing protein 1 n=1 Tax=Epinephelus fuscoguttatus TaxID=293821 RepID=UPI0020CFEA7F|nr:leucine-rich repeat and transmembrane domain-containing protein 1 [Epinephelus fuscoguttatus]